MFKYKIICKSEWEDVFVCVLKKDTCTIKYVSVWKCVRACGF